MPPTSYGTDLDIFLQGLYPDFEAIEDQGQQSIEQLKKAFIVNTDPNLPALFTQKNYENQQIARFVYITGVGKLGKRNVGGPYPEVEQGKRGFITQVEFDPNDEDAGMISIPDEYRDRLNPQVRDRIATAQSLMNRALREIWKGYFDMLEYAFTQPSNYPRHLFARGNSADNPTGALNNPLMSSHHPLVNSSAEGVNVLTNSLPLSEEALWKMFELGGNIVDDWNEKMPIGFGLGFTLIIPNDAEMVPIALQLIGAEKQPFTADNNVNLIKGILGNVIISNYLTGKKWFVVPNKDRHSLYGTGLLDVSFVPLTAKGPEVNNDLDSIVWKLKYQKRWGWIEWRYIIGSKGDNSNYTL